MSDYNVWLSSLKHTYTEKKQARQQWLKTNTKQNIRAMLNECVEQVSEGESRVYSSRKFYRGYFPVDLPMEERSTVAEMYGPLNRILSSKEGVYPVGFYLVSNEGLLGTYTILSFDCSSDAFIEALAEEEFKTYLHRGVL